VSYGDATVSQADCISEHKDLGLLSLVVGDTPGLEVWDRYVSKWYCLERTFTTPAASVLVGRQLECLSNGRYIAGGHRVRSYPDHAMPRTSTPVDVAKKYRYSIVFVLRAHSPIPINTDDLTTDITGGFKRPLRNISAGEMFQAINSSHYNINTHREEREEQKRKLAETEKTPAGSMR
jgi:isopenicillin N synthase-like dioxygenase